MNTTIKASCDTCGDVDLVPDELRLVYFATDPDRTFYEFKCKGQCKRVISKHADPDVVARLISAGIKPEKPPAEVLEVHQGPLFGPDDVLDLHLLLQQDELVDELLSEIARGVEGLSAA